MKAQDHDDDDEDDIGRQIKQLGNKTKSKTRGNSPDAPVEVTKKVIDVKKWRLNSRKGELVAVDSEEGKKALQLSK